MWMIDIDQLEFIHPTLRELLNDRRTLFPEFYGTITSLYRIPVGPPDSVHEVIPLRGIDERCHIIVLGNEIKTELNKRWIYDTTRPTKKVCRFHDVGLGLHLHYQVHNSRTVRRWL
ncbi:MAG: hypothetical protein ACW987_18745 [Candidatus Thorarchaeota archaeon]|jgi:hypothetical protein